MESKIWLIVVCILVLSQTQATGSIQIYPNNATLFSSTEYFIAYYTIYNMPSSTSFNLDFSSTYISIPDSALNISATVNDSAVNGATATCSNMKCIVKLNNAVVATSRILFKVGSLTNPYFLGSQNVIIKITFNSSYNEPLTYTISSSVYQPINMGVTSFTQSNYGVGNTNVSYTFNLTVPLTPSNPQLTITIPS